MAQNDQENQPSFAPLILGFGGGICGNKRDKKCSPKARERGKEWEQRDKEKQQENKRKQESERERKVQKFS